MKDTILVVSKRVVHEASKLDWPDLNYPGSGLTILRVLYKIDYDKYSIQLDGPEGPIFNKEALPEGVCFYKAI